MPITLASSWLWPAALIRPSAPENGFTVHKNKVWGQEWVDAVVFLRRLTRWQIAPADPSGELTR